MTDDDCPRWDETIANHRKAKSLLTRYQENPILTPSQWPYPANSVFNPGATEQNGETVLLVRVEDMRGFSHITAARSKDGFTDWRIDPQPTLVPDPEYYEEQWGLEDPRIVWLQDRQEYGITYVSFSPGGPLVSLCTTKDFRTFERYGRLVPPEDKDASLLPRRCKGRYALIHRPIIRGQAHIWISFSPDLKHWGDHQVLIPTRAGWWDSRRVGLATQPVETPEGWLVMYHGVRLTTAGQIYRLGLVLLDLDDPRKIIRRTAAWIFGPQARYERVGDVPDVVFPTGAILDRATNQLRIYYGAADSAVAVATADLNELLEYLKTCQE
jgi:predicted GH43/DUF377 family glycosyl hydrolase